MTNAQKVLVEAMVVVGIVVVVLFGLNSVAKRATGVATYPGQVVEVASRGVAEVVVANPKVHLPVVLVPPNGKPYAIGMMTFVTVINGKAVSCSTPEFRWCGDGQGKEYINNFQE